MYLCIAAFVGVTSEALSVPFECNFRRSTISWPASILAIWMRLLTPCVVLTGLILIYVLFWIIRHFTDSPNAESTGRLRANDLITGVIVIGIVTVHFSYIDNVREMLRIVNCVHVEADDASLRTHPYGQYAVEEGITVWAEDTDLLCFRGKHYVTGIAGIVGLMLALMLIIFTILWMPINRKQSTSTQFVARYWFIYQAYKSNWYTVPWEAAILLRKTLISAVIVFSFQLGPSLQAALCVGILIVAHSLQVVFQPFKVPENHVHVPDYAGHFLKAMHLPKLAVSFIRWSNSLSLNALESASLLCSLFVFYTAVILTDIDVSDIAVQLTAIVAVSANILFLLYVLYRLYWGLHVLLDLRLELDNPAFVATHENDPGCFHLMRKLYRVFRVVIQRYIRERGKTTEGESADEQ